MELICFSTTEINFLAFVLMMLSRQKKKKPNPDCLDWDDKDLLCALYPEVRCWESYKEEHTRCQHQLNEMKKVRTILACWIKGTGIAQTGKEMAQGKGSRHC